MNTPLFVDVLDFRVFSDDLNAIAIGSDKCRTINTISPNSYGLSLKDQAFKAALKKTDYLVLDGVYFAFASLMLKGKNIKKNQGPDVFYHFMERVNKKGGKVFFLGSSPQTLQKMENRVKTDYLNIESKSYSPPFKENFSDADNQAMLDAVNEFKPEILFVGMTCPKQEKWATEFRGKINAGLVISIGNVFDWFAGTQKAIHPFWFKIRMAWLIRIFYRPEIFRRNIKNQMTFFGDVIMIFLKLKRI
ncbi:glycosyltransferase [Pedobacter chinensis]|uniref:Glycosyltransferase n=1 Tax=Pedobacter chinensis TaxID=2282421 RepID=A0A369PP40_9SPHI|nr:WecB/TagA/CpsF family glycosyltransferase [Pedobacter chinensis]RDC54304.1 glycosyltransferase [Pedobacter chinensis]